MPEAYFLLYTLVMYALCILESLFLPKYILILNYENLNNNQFPCITAQEQNN